MCNVFKKYGKIIFLFMIVFIGSFFSINKVEAAEGRIFKCDLYSHSSISLNYNGKYYLNEDTFCRNDIINIANKNIELDLNGYSLGILGQLKIDKGSNVTIKDSRPEEAGIIVFNSDSISSNIFVSGNSKLTINGGAVGGSDKVQIFTVESGSSLIVNNVLLKTDGKRVIGIRNKANVTINGGRVIAPNAYLIYGLSEKTNAENVTINGIVKTDIKSVDTRTSYYAERPNDFYISYFDGNEKIKSSKYYLSKTKTLDLMSYTKPGYTFEGWYTSPTFEEDTKIEKINPGEIGDITVYAKTTCQIRNINYYNGKVKLEGLEPSTYIIGENTTLPTYEMDGYTFYGWYNDEELTSKATDITSSSNTDKTFYAKMIPNTYTLNYYDGDTELLNLTPKLYTYAETTQLPTYDKEVVGHTFIGWTFEKDGTEPITILDETTLGNKNLYAYYEANNYLVNYELNGGTNDNKNPLSYKYNKNEITTLDGTKLEATKTNLKNPTRRGYTFQGWYDNAEFTGEKITFIETSYSGDRTLYAKWSPNIYTITLDDNMGHQYTIQALYDSKMPDVTPLTREGYIFDGYYDKDSNQYYNSLGQNIKNSELTSDDILYAKWIPIKYEVIWKDGDGNVIYISKEDYDSIPVYDIENYGEPTKSINSEEGIAYRFIGWDSEIGVVKGDAVYTAIFEEFTDFNIIYHYGNLLLTGIDPERYIVGEETPLPTEISGFDIEGWYSDSELKNKITSIPADMTGDVDVYAKMKSAYNDNYEGDNLILHLDGINHGSTIGVWEDLSNNKNNLVLASNHSLESNHLNSSKLTTALTNTSITKNVLFTAEPEEFTIELVGMYNSEQDGMLAAIYDSSKANEGIQLYQSSSNQNVLYYETSDEGQYYATYTYSPVVGQKIYRTITYNKAEGTLKLYENGELLVTKSVSGNLGLANKKLQLGEANWSTDLALDGKIYSVRVYGKSLTEEQVKQNYEVDKERFSTNVSYSKDNLIINLDGTNPGSISGKWQDISGNGNHATINGATYNKNGYTFDGTDDYLTFEKNHHYQNVTIDVLVKPNEQTSIGTIISNVNDGGYGMLLEDSKFKTINTIDDEYSTLVNDNTTINDIYLMTYTYDGKVEKMFVNGEMISYKYTSGTPKSPLNTLLTIGANPESDGSYIEHLNGTIYSVRMYDAALTEGEIKQNYELDKEKYNSTIDYSAPENYISDNLIINLDGTNPGSTTGKWEDLSGNGNHGTINGATRSENGYTFDGSNDYVVFDKSHNYDKFTMEVVVKPGTQPDDENAIFGNLHTGGYGISISDNLIKGLMYSLNEKKYSSIYAGIASYDNNFVISLTFDGTNQKLYVNGNLVATATPGTYGTSSSMMMLGANPSGSTPEAEYYKGKIYAARLYDTALTEEEIKQNYELDKEKYSSNTQENLIIHLDGNNPGSTSGKWQDISGNGNHGTINGATWDGNGLKFDGNDYVKFSKKHDYETVSIEVVFKTSYNEESHILGNWADGGYGVKTGASQAGSTTFINGGYSDIRVGIDNKINVLNYTYDGVYEKIYLNGILVQNVKNVGTIEYDTTETITLALGANPDANGVYTGHFIGTIYSAKLYSDALTEEEVKQSYAEAKSKYINEYNISYYNGKVKLEGLEPSSYTHGEVKTFANFEEPGYTFSGWYTSPTFESDTKVESTKESDIIDYKLYGKIEPNEYTITFEENGGSEVEDITDKYLTEIKLPVPTKEGYDFGGWYLDELLTKEATSQIPLGDSKYYAKWVGKTYLIDYYYGELKLDVKPSEYTYGKTLTLPTEVEGYEFNGWYTSPTFEEDTKVENITITDIGDKKFYGNLVPKEYTISFESNGGSKVESITQYFNTEVTAPADPTKENYAFEGWYTDATLQTKYEFTTMPAKDMILYANWSNATYIVTWLNSDGSEIYSSEVEYGTMPVYDEETYGLPTTKEQAEEGYEFEFAGWNPEVVEVSQETSYTATFVKKASEYKISYYFGNIQLSEIEPNTYTYGVGTELQDLNLTGYVFEGWYTSPTFEEETKVESISETDIGDKVLYAKTNVDEYTITFESNGGSTVESITQNYGVVISAPTEPTKENYTFAGWYSDEELTIPYEFTTMPGEDITLYAKWNGNLQKITWLNFDGSEIYSSEVEYGTMPVYDEETYGIPTYAKDGYTYTFIGWDPEIVEATTDTTYTAKFEELANSYNIEYYHGLVKLEGIEPSSYVYGIGTELSSVEIEGYTFDGWYTSEAFEEETKVESISETDIGDKVLYAKTSINQYTITFEENGGSEVADITADYASEITLPESTLDGYTLEGWYLDNNYEIKFEEKNMPGEDITLYANWVMNEYTISWVDGNGEVIYSEKYQHNQIPSYNTEYGTPVKNSENEAIQYTFSGWTPEIVEATTDTTYTATFDEVVANYEIIYYDHNYEIIELTPNTYTYGVGTELPNYETIYGEFEGWYTSPTFEDETKVERISVTDSGDKTLYAKVKLNEYTITFEENGGTTVEDITQGHGTDLELPESVYDGFVFAGWYKSSTFEEDTLFEEYVMPGENITLYAKWDVIKYTITFEENGGSEVEDIIEQSGQAILSPEAPIKEGYTFDNWYTDETLETPFEFNVMPENDITLYAKWNINQYTITFEENGGSEVEDIVKDFGVEVAAPADPMKIGYAFEGWFIDEELTTPYIFSTMPGENITLYAKWNINEYTITFNSLGGSEVETIIDIYGATINEPVAPTKEGHEFKGWYKDTSFTIPFEFTTMPAEDIILYANWEISKHTISWINPDGTVIYQEEREYGEIPSYDEETYGIPTYNKTGYTTVFKNWDKEPEEIKTDQTYTAIYDETVNTYNITYYNGEVKLEGLEPSTYTYEVGTELPVYEVEHYTFGGWYTSPTFEEDTKVEKITETDYDDKTLYAKMVRNEFTIYFETNGGSTIEPIKQTAGEPITAPTEPTKVGYVFDNWYTDETLETPFEFNVMPENDTTLYAKWNEIQIEIVNKEIELFVEEEQQININTIPEGATLTFTYTPTDNIVSVSETGLIKGLTAGETTVTVKVTENPNIEETITVKVNSKEIESETYSVEQKENVKIVIGMDEGVTIETLLNSLTNKSDYLNVYDKEGNKITDHTQVVSTGLKIKLEKEDKVYDEVTTIVRGDLDEDGIINVTDELMLQEHILFINVIDDYRKYAADVVVDDIIDVTDDIKLSDYILKSISTIN